MPTKVVAAQTVGRFPLSPWPSKWEMRARRRATTARLSDSKKDSP